MNGRYIAPMLVLALLGCKTSNPSEEFVQAEMPVVKTAMASEMPFAQRLTYPGTVFANRESNLGAALPGKVERIRFSEGDKVKQGDLIVELSDELLIQAEVENQALRKDFERVERLKEKESISQMEYDHLKAKLEASDAKTNMLRKNTRVYAPFSGTIVERMMEEGEIYFINPGLDPGYSMRSGIVRLMQLNPIRIEFEVNEKDLTKLKRGLQAEILVDAYPEKTYQGKIHSVKPMLSTLTRTAKVQVILENNLGELKPGMFARVSIVLPNQQLIFVPLSAITRLAGTGEEFVYVVEDNTAKRVVINQIQTLGNNVAVTGIKAGQMVIVEGKAKVQNGSKVDVI
ncbi:MAG: efflux RND transporter periplasmic adaptor subunit [Bacteroidales bacterium]|mgnify:CR=1 FL=1|jgi:membrane fusion protein (multidrug efflux system)|nr:efflux RND transporter periplasmic adaptor subunit [Bacteroidales bacterium]MDD4384089.1 efflux RND transporter periplasmic adaptor subunit [Bacteroidales bacterium]MDY0197220.1 efflux RND transporter periplasmic adaptor subunit [Tenuifilaceae bacterium]